MFKKIFILCLGVASFSNVWADDVEDIEEVKALYDNLSAEDKEEFKKRFRANGWMDASSGREYQSYMHYDYVKPLPYGKVEVWLKSVVINDLTKDGLSLGDYSMELVQYNCNDRTSKNISYTDYSKTTGKVINSYTYPTYDNFKAVIPESVGESRLEGACLINHIKTH